MHAQDVTHATLTSVFFQKEKETALKGGWFSPVSEKDMFGNIALITRASLDP